MTSGGDAVVHSVVSTVGLWWPDAEQEQLRAAADAWDRMAVALDVAAAAGRSGAVSATRDWTGEAADAFAGRWALVERDGLATSAGGCRALAGGLRAYADEVERAKHEIEALAVEVGAGIVLGAATAWFTFGASAAVAGGVAARLVSLAAAIGVRVSQSVAAISATALNGAVFGTAETVAANAVGQAFRVEALGEGGYSGSELTTAAASGATGGALAGGIGGAVATRALRDSAPSGDLLRAPGGAIRAALEPTDWGPLHRAWAPGVVEDAARLKPHERPTAQFLAGEGAMVHSRATRNVTDYKNPDLLVRRGPDDPGTYTELKSVNNRSNPVAKGVREANAQLNDVGGGTIVIDGRASGLTEANTLDGWRRGLNDITNAGESPPTSVRVLLGDGRELWLP